MGINIDRSEFRPEEYIQARIKLGENLGALERLLRRPGFGVGETSVGAELEMNVVDHQGWPLPVNRRVLADALDPHLQLELDNFNLEYNVSPVPAAGRPFTAMREELERALELLGRIAARYGGRIIPVGILPTLTLDHLQSSALTDLPRYHALSAGIRRIRQSGFHIRINGDEPLDTFCDSVAIEGANTSFQLHLRVDPGEFACLYNAAQLATPLVLAVAANSPFLLGHRLWDETRVALFKQSVDTRGGTRGEWRRAARVPFGNGWVRHGAYELFAEACHLYPILIPLRSEEDVTAVTAAGGIPELLELRLHQGTIWNWNRPVYDASAGGHLRIELRALPSGPTPIDMMANAAFLLGLTVGLSRSVDALLPAFPFRYAEYNFYRAAQRGLSAELLWPTLDGSSPRQVVARTLCREMLEDADRGLEELGVDVTERTSLLQLIAERLDQGTTPAEWQRRTLASFESLPRQDALARLVETYASRIATGRPVTEWC